jgi:hypothetical protein
MNEPTVLRPLTLGQLLDTTFTMYRQNFVLFFGVAALPYLIMLGFQLFVATLQKTGSPNNLAAIGAIAIGFLGTMAVYLVAIAVAQAASFFAVSAVHLREPVTIGSAYSRVKGHLLVVLGTSILTGIASFTGLLFLIVPGVIIWLAMTCAIPAALFEDLDPIDAMKRSWNLTDGAKGRLFLLVLLWYATILGLSMLVGLAVVALAGLSAIGKPATAMPMGILVLQQVANFLVSAVTAPILTVGITLVYYDQRVRKEAFDLQHMMTVLGSRPPSPPQAASAGIS